MSPIDQKAKLCYLLKYLISERPQYKSLMMTNNYSELRQLLRAMMNTREPAPLSAEFLQIQDQFLQEEQQTKTITSAKDIPTSSRYPRLAIWRGDITTLQADAIVNAANSSLLGCFIPCHNCIDNAIHSAAGLQLREECYQIMNAQGHQEATGQAKITKGYNLPATYVIHTVGPIVEDIPTDKDIQLLASCYSSSLQIAQERQLATIAFCCISTGVFHFPQQQAAEIAVHTVLDYLDKHQYPQKVIFNVFTDSDEKIYQQLLA